MSGEEQFQPWRDAYLRSVAEVSLPALVAALEQELERLIVRRWYLEVGAPTSLRGRQVDDRIASLVGILARLRPSPAPNGAAVGGSVTTPSTPDGAGTATSPALRR